MGLLYSLCGYLYIVRRLRARQCVDWCNTDKPSFVLRSAWGIWAHDASYTARQDGAWFTTITSSKSRSKHDIRLVIALSVLLYAAARARIKISATGRAVSQFPLLNGSCLLPGQLTAQWTIEERVDVGLLAQLAHVARRYLFASFIYLGAGNKLGGIRLYCYAIKITRRTPIIWSATLRDNLLKTCNSTQVSAVERRRLTIVSSHTHRPPLP